MRSNGLIGSLPIWHRTMASCIRLFLCLSQCYLYCGLSVRHFLTDADEDDRRIDSASAKVFPSDTRVSKQGEKTSCPEGNKLQFTVHRSIRREKRGRESHRGQGYGILETKRHTNGGVIILLLLLFQLQPCLPWLVGCWLTAAAYLQGEAVEGGVVGACGAAEGEILIMVVL